MRLAYKNDLSDQTKLSHARILFDLQRQGAFYFSL